ncbi:MAG TPA: ATP-binding protein [Candidatus Limnocylindria bacterium]|nr:ATP-binding protein [Candidatus Limnocylindria bacterium]
MTLHIVKSTDRIEVQTITLLIYGSPGIGKTSIAFTAESPLLLDVDRGAHRSGFRKDSVRIEKWSDVSSMTAADLADYKTIIVDTVGRLLDVMSADIIQKNPKMQGYGGALSLQGYGALKAAYATWLGSLASMGKDVVLVAHDKEDKKGDELIVRPDIQGGSYGEVFKRADGIAYMYRSGRSTVLDFSPTDRWIGKNAAGFEPLTVPDFNQRGDYFATVIADTKAAMNRMSEDQQRVVAEIAAWQERAESAASAADVNALVTEAGALAPPVGPQAKFAIATRAKALNLEWKGAKGKGNGAYVETTAQQRDLSDAGAP